MMTVRACPELAPLVRAELHERLRAIGDGSKAELTRPPASAEAEEALRQLMVLYRPRIRKRAIAGDDLAAMLDRAAVVSSAAHIDDLRFVDGLNATFEAWDGGYEVEARAAFLAIYRSALWALVDS